MGRQKSGDRSQEREVGRQKLGVFEDLIINWRIVDLES